MDDVRSGSASPASPPQPKPAGRFLRAAPAALIAVPLVWAMSAYVTGSSPRPMAAEPPRPALAFAQHVVDLGKMRSTSEAFAHFDFINRGQIPVVIRKIEPSCGCLKVEWQETIKRLKKSKYYPGEGGHFVVRLDTAQQKPGPLEYRIDVDYDDPEPQHVELTFRLVLPDDQVSVYPPAMLLTYFGTTTDTVRDIEVVDRRAHPLTIREIRCTREGLIGIGPVTSDTDEHGFMHHRFQVTIPGNLPEGLTSARIGIYTDDKRDFPLLRVPFRVNNAGSLSSTSRPMIDRHVQPAGAAVEEQPAPE